MTHHPLQDETPRQFSRRSFLRLLAGGALIGGVGAVGGTVYASQVEPYSLRVVEKTILLTNLPRAFEGFRIAHITDFHLEDWTTPEYLAEVFEKVNTQKADMIAITGDFVTWMTPYVMGNLSRLLPILSAPDGVFGVLGNHDHWVSRRLVSESVRSGGVNLLVNQSHAVMRGDSALYIAGVDDIWQKQNDLPRALANVPPGACIVLLAHEPDYADAVAQDGRVGLQLSGHSHGGQVRLPVIGAPILPPLGEKYDLGYYRIGDLQLYTNPGIGMARPAVRLNCPPEITVLTLQSV